MSRLCRSCVVEVITVTSYGSDKRQVSAVDNPRSETITSLDVLIKLLYLLACFFVM